MEWHKRIGFALGFATAIYIGYVVTNIIGKSSSCCVCAPPPLFEYITMALLCVTVISTFVVLCIATRTLGKKGYNQINQIKKRRLDGKIIRKRKKV